MKNNPKQYVYVPISVEDELPPLGYQVCIVNGEWEIYYFGSEDGRDLKINTFKVTHWLRKTPVLDLLELKDKFFRECVAKAHCLRLTENGWKLKEWDVFSFNHGTPEEMWNWITQNIIPTKDEWISVEAELPEKREGWSNSKDVNICYQDGVVSTGSYSYFEYRWVDYLYIDRKETITHWQPLPKAPTKDE